jgi:hypothetical protein
LEEEIMDHQAFAQLLGNYGEFVGAIGVVATLAYLAVQIRQSTASVQQSNRIAIANTEISVRGGYGSLSRMITENADVAAAFVQAQSEDGDLDDVTQLRLHYFFVQMANQWHAMEIAFEQDMIPRATYEVMFDDHRFFIETYPGVRHLLRNVLQTWTALSETASFKSIDRLLKERGN